MKSELSSSRKNLLFKYNNKYFKEEQLESKQSELINVNQIKNFVPKIKPKKAHIRPTPFQFKSRRAFNFKKNKFMQKKF